MQAAHPQFHFHEGNWLIRHLAISHLTNMNRKFRRMDPDPDVEHYRKYLVKKNAVAPTSEGYHRVRLSFIIYVLSLLLQKTPANVPPASMTSDNPLWVRPRANPCAVGLPTVSLTCLYCPEISNLHIPFDPGLRD